MHVGAPDSRTPRSESSRKAPLLNPGLTFLSGQVRKTSSPELPSRQTPKLRISQCSDSHGSSALGRTSERLGASPGVSRGLNPTRAGMLLISSRNLTNSRLAVAAEIRVLTSHVASASRIRIGPLRSLRISPQTYIVPRGSRSVFELVQCTRSRLTLA